MRSLRCNWLATVHCFGAVLLSTSNVTATEYTWDNWSGDSSFQTALNWSPVAVPGTTDTATFDGLLGGSGIGNNNVYVADGTAVEVMKVIDTAIVDMIIGDGTTASRFDMELTSGNSLIIGDSSGDTAIFNLKGGWLDTWQTYVSGRANFNIVGAGSYWDSTAVLISGDTIASTAGIGVGLSAQIDSNSQNVDVGSDTGSGRIVVDGTPQVLFGPSAAWDGIGALDVGPTGTYGFNFGQVTLQAGGQLSAASAGVHGTTDVQSKITVKTGGDLTVSGLLQIGPYSALELMNTASSITTGQLTSTGGSFNWTGGTLEISASELHLDSTNPDSVFGSSLTVGSGKKLITSNPNASGAFDIGQVGSGTGSLTVSDGGIVESYFAHVGEGNTSSGTALVSGTGSRWDISTDLRIGDRHSATGQLTIQDQATVTVSNQLALGRQDTANGDVIVTDSGTLLSVNKRLDVAGGWQGGSVYSDGGTGSLTVTGGGRVEVASLLKVWSGGTVTVNSPSTIVADKVDISAGATFNINAGAVLYTNQLIGFGNNPVIGGNLLIGHADGPTAASYSVGSGQSLTTGSNLVIGVDKPAMLIVSDGGYVNSLNGFIGGMPGSDGSSVTLSGSGSGWHINGALNIGGDGYNVGGPSTLLIQNDAAVDADGWVTAWPDSTITLNLGTLHAANVELAGAELIGKGPVNLGSGMLFNAGRVYPYTGVIDVAGSYSQGSDGELACVLYGHAGMPGVDFSQLNVSGAASLEGVLRVFYQTPYTPALSDSFHILAAPSGITGRFDQVFLPDFGTLGLRIDYNDPYSVYIRAGLTGDLNGDGFVGLDDLDIVLNRWNHNATAGVWIEGDPSGDGYVGLADLDIILNNWNAGTPPASVSIPEPASLPFISVFLCLTTLRRKHRH